MLMVHRTFLGMIGEEKLKNPSLIPCSAGREHTGNRKPQKLFLFLFFSFSFTDVLFPAFSLLFFSLFSTSSDIINYSETPLTRTLRGASLFQAPR